MGVTSTLHVARGFECIPLVKRQQQICAYTAPQLINHLCVYLVWVSLIYRHTDTVRCRTNAVSFLQNIHERHLTARIAYRLWVQSLIDVIDVLPQFLQ